MGLGELRRRGVLTWVTATLAIGVLAGCTGSNGAEPTPSVTSTDAADGPTETPTQTATATPEVPEVEKPTPPDAMRRDDIAGAEAAATYFTQLYMYVYATGDLVQWEAMSHPECMYCASVVENLASLAEAGQHLEGGETEIVRVSGREPLPGNEFYAVDVEVAQQPTFIVNAEEREVDTSGGNAVLSYAVGRGSDSWIIRGVDVEDLG